MILAATKQLFEWSCLSVTPFSQCSCYRIMVKFLGVIAITKNDVHAKVQRGERSRSLKSKQILSQLWNFWTVTQFWIHMWLQNDWQSLKWYRRGYLLFCKVIHPISRSHGPKKMLIGTCFWMMTPVQIYRWLWSDAQSLDGHRKGDLLFIKVIHTISRSQGQKNCQFGLDFSVPCH